MRPERVELNAANCSSSNVGVVVIGANLETDLQLMRQTSCLQLDAVMW
jgi:hypothetical protein